MDDKRLTGLKEALALSPDNLPLKELLALALVEAGEETQAEEHLRALVTVNPDRHDLRLVLAQVLRNRGALSEALVRIEDIVAITTEDKIKTLYLDILLEDESIEDAVKAYKMLKNSDPGFNHDEVEELLAEEDSPEVNYNYQEQEAAGGIIPMEKPGINFSHVGGMDKVKEEISMKIINPIKHEKLFRSFGKKIGGGILLYGPPGCGKTYMARATAGEIDASFLNIGLQDVLDMYIGNSEKQLHELFEFARNHKPAVVFFDEVDALGASRGDLKSSAGRNLINQFLVELDGIDSDNDGVLVLGATNAPWYLDSAFRRPGRFDAIIFVPPPDHQARKSILELLLAERPKENIDLETLAKATRHFSGSDLKALVDKAADEKLKEILKTGKEVPLDDKDLQKALKQIKPSTRDWFETAKNYALYANQSGLYDEILEYMRINK